MRKYSKHGMRRNYVYNEKTMTYELSQKSKVRQVFRRLGIILLGAAAVVFWLWLYLVVFGFELPKTTVLRKRNAAYSARLAEIDRNADLCEATLRGIEDRDDDVYRSIYGLNEISPDTRHAGIAGANRYAWLDECGAGPSLKKTFRRLDNLFKRSYLQSIALSEVRAVSSQAGDMVACIPAVPPINPDKKTYHLSSPFGYRSDPVRRRGGEFHKGIDFAGTRGAPIYSTGDGVVDKAEVKFSGYGNEIVINHGYGYKTRYAHLASIEVVEGQKIHRGDKIGTLGSSGRSTGPHLHYEVLYKGAQVNPWPFMDLSMDPDEYKAMVKKRSEESSQAQRQTASDLQKRQDRQKTNARQ